mgnify:CR=1 FL=1
MLVQRMRVAANSSLVRPPRASISLWKGAGTGSSSGLAGSHGAVLIHGSRSVGIHACRL